MAYLDDNPPATQQFRCPRNASLSGIIGVHTAESHADTDGPDSGAENTAGFIRRRSGYGSYHYLVDSDSIINLVELDCVAYHMATHGLNEHTIGISAAVQAHEWETYSDDYVNEVIHNMAVAAARSARHIKKRTGITVPAKRISLSQALNGEPGFLAHGDADPDRRTDPGPRFDWNLFLNLYAALMAGELPDVGGSTMSWDEDLTPGTPGNDITGLADDTLPSGAGRYAADLLGYAAASFYDGRNNMAPRIWSKRWPWRKWIKDNPRNKSTVENYPNGFTMQALLQNAWGYLRVITSWEWLRDTLGRAVWSRRAGGDGDMHATRLGRADRNAAKAVELGQQAVAMAQANNDLLAVLVDRDPGNPLSEDAVRTLFQEAMANNLVSVDVSVTDGTQDEDDTAPVEDQNAEEDQPESDDPVDDNDSK